MLSPQSPAAHQRAESFSTGLHLLRLTCSRLPLRVPYTQCFILLNITRFKNSEVLKLFYMMTFEVLLEGNIVKKMKSTYLFWPFKVKIQKSCMKFVLPLLSVAVSIFIQCKGSRAGILFGWSYEDE